MRIPTPTVGHYLSASDPVAEDRRARQVAALSELADAFPKSDQAFDEMTEHTTKRATLLTIEGNGESGARDKAAQERRRGERRKKDTPLTLDTRLVRCRRQSARSSTLSVKA